MRKIILILALFMLTGATGGSCETNERTKVKKRQRRSKNRSSRPARLIKETFNDADGPGCQWLQIWKLEGRRIACCTDDRSEPLYFCVDDRGFETGDYRKIPNR